MAYLQLPKLNPTKTEAIFLHLTLRSSTLPEPPPISLDNTTLPYSQHVRNLGFHIDTTLSIDYHLIHMHTSIHYHLHCLRLIGRSFPSPSLLSLPPPTSSPYSTIATPYSLTSRTINSSNYRDSKTQ